MGLPLTQPMISEILKENGYQTQMIGKWHLGFNKERDPLGRGFDEFYGFLNGSHDYYTAEKEFGTNIGLWPIFDNRTPVDFKGYTTEVFTDQAVDYIERADSDNPFFVYLSYNAVHHPWQVPQSYIDRLPHIEEPDRRKFAGMLLAMDDGIGRVIDALKEKGEFDNTLLVFFSDNGSPSGQSGNMSNTGGYRGWKGDTYEGGIRVPFVMCWANEIPAGAVYDKPISAFDIAPTVSACVNAENPTKDGFAFDGVNILPYIKGEKGDALPHDVLFWRRDNHYAIRKGDWKLTYNYPTDVVEQINSKPMLFNMAVDEYETTDLSEIEPSILEQLQHEFDLWDTTLPDNKYWGGPINRKYNYKE